MNTLTGVELDAAVASVLGEQHFVLQLCATMGNAFNPSTHAGLAMRLLIEQKITLLYSPNWDEKNNEIPHWAAGWHHYDCDDFEMESEGTGATPQDAICRAIVQRAEDQAREAFLKEKSDAARAHLVALTDAARAHLVALTDTAWDRANHTRRTRTPWTEFANDEEREAYRVALERQLAGVRRSNDLPDPAEDIVSSSKRPL